VSSGNLNSRNPPAVHRDARFVGVDLPDRCGCTWAAQSSHTVHAIQKTFRQYKEREPRYLGTIWAGGGCEALAGVFAANDFVERMRDTVILLRVNYEISGIRFICRSFINIEYNEGSYFVIIDIEYRPRPLFLSWRSGLRNCRRTLFAFSGGDDGLVMFVPSSVKTFALAHSILRFFVDSDVPADRMGVLGLDRLFD